MHLNFKIVSMLCLLIPIMGCMMMGCMLGSALIQDSVYQGIYEICVFEQYAKDPSQTRRPGENIPDYNAYKFELQQLLDDPGNISK